MPMKLRKLQETATLEAGATIPRAFSYKTAFFIFIACLVGFGGLVYLGIHLMTMNLITTTDCEAVPLVEMDLVAHGEGKIVSMRVSYGDAVKEGQELFEIQPRADSADKAKLDELWADVMVVLTDAERRYKDALARRDVAQAEVGGEESILKSKKKEVSLINRGKERELKEAELRQDRAAAYFAVAENNYNNAKEYYEGENRLITLDKFLAAREEHDIRKLERDFAEKQVGIYEQALEDARAEGDARIEAQQEQINKAKSILKVREDELATVKKEYAESLKAVEDYSSAAGTDARAEAIDRADAEGAGRPAGTKVEKAILILKHFKKKKGFGVYRAPFSGKVGWMKCNEGDPVEADDFLMKLFKSDGMEIEARLAQSFAGRLAKGQKVDVKIRTKEKDIRIKGRVEAITNQFYTLRPNVRERVRIENPTAEMNLVVVRISLEGKEKEILYPGDPVTVTIHTSE